LLDLIICHKPGSLAELEQISQRKKTQFIADIKNAGKIWRGRTAKAIRQIDSTG
jgi:hypothetical protein